MSRCNRGQVHVKGVRYRSRAIIQGLEIEIFRQRIAIYQENDSNYGSESKVLDSNLKL
jgi:hypothetical protein